MNKQTFIMLCKDRQIINPNTGEVLLADLVWEDWEAREVPTSMLANLLMTDSFRDLRLVRLERVDCWMCAECQHFNTYVSNTVNQVCLSCELPYSDESADVQDLIKRVAALLPEPSSQYWIDGCDDENTYCRDCVYAVCKWLKGEGTQPDGLDHTPLFDDKDDLFVSSGSDEGDCSSACDVCGVRLNVELVSITSELDHFSSHPPTSVNEWQSVQNMLDSHIDQPRVMQLVVENSESLLLALSQTSEIDAAIALCHQLKSQGNVFVKSSSHPPVFALKDGYVRLDNSEKTRHILPLSRRGSTTDCIHAAYMFVNKYPSTTVEFHISTQTSAHPHRLLFHWNDHEVQVVVHGEKATKVKRQVETVIKFYNEQKVN